MANPTPPLVPAVVPAVVPAPEAAPICPVCFKEGRKRVPVVPVRDGAKHWMHATDYERAKTCHVSVWAERPMQPKEEETKP